MEASRTAERQPQVEPVPSPLRSGTWREEVRSRITWLRSEVRWLELHHDTDRRAAPGAIAEEVHRPLSEAELLSARRAGVRDWWSGRLVEECWRLLRQAEEGLLRIADLDALLPLSRSAEAHAAALGAAHPSRTAVQEARARAVQGGGRTSTDELRAAALAAVRAAHEVSDGRHRAARSLRNQLLTLSIVLGATAGLAVVLQAWLEARLLPEVESSITPTQTLVVAMFFGCVGALFSAVPSLAQVPENSSPFNLPRQQALLKVLVGAWSAVIGLLVLSAGLADEGAAALTSVGGLAVLSALFGTGQEAVTRFADHKASSILGGS